MDKSYKYINTYGRLYSSFFGWIFEKSEEEIMGDNTSVKCCFYNKDDIKKIKSELKR